MNIEQKVDAITYWQEAQREAGRMLAFWIVPEINYYSSEDFAYVKCWQERHAYCYRKIVCHRGF